MKKTVLFLLSLAACLVANATIIGVHTTDGGKTVNLSGLEWLEWSETFNRSSADILSNLGTGGDLEGWRVATRTEFEALFDSLWGGTIEGWHTSNRDGGDWLYDNFGSAFGGVGGSNVFFGYEGGQWLYGHWRGGGSGNEGWFLDQYGLSTGVDSFNAQYTAGSNVAASYANGFALVRGGSVPDVGSSLLLIGIGLASLSAIRRRTT